MSFRRNGSSGCGRSWTRRSRCTGWGAPTLLTNLVRRQRPDGSGDLILTREPGTLSEGWAGGSNWAAYAWREVGLFGLADARAVERIIRQHLLQDGQPLV